MREDDLDRGVNEAGAFVGMFIGASIIAFIMMGFIWFLLMALTDHFWISSIMATLALIFSYRVSIKTFKEMKNKNG